VAQTEPIRAQKACTNADKTGLRIDLHKEWCKMIFISHSLEIDFVFRATIKPAYQRLIPNIWTALWFTLQFLFAKGCQTQLEDLQQTALISSRPFRRRGSTVAFAVLIAVLVLFGSVSSS